MKADQVERDLHSMLETLPHSDGVNNHQSSRATADAKLDTQRVSCGGLDLQHARYSGRHLSHGHRWHKVLHRPVEPAGTITTYLIRSGSLFGERVGERYSDHGQDDVSA